MFRAQPAIRHAETAQIHEIDADQIDFEAVASDERGMGPEKDVLRGSYITRSSGGSSGIYWNILSAPRITGKRISACTSFWRTSISGLQQEPPDDDYRQVRIYALLSGFRTV